MAEITDFPNNSNTAVEQRVLYSSVSSEEETRERPAKSAAIEGKVKRRKQSVGQRLMHQLIEEDIPAVKDYLIDEVILPGIKNLTWDIFAGGLSRFFWGGDTPPSNVIRSGGSTYSRPVNHYDYGRAYRSNTSATNAYSKPKPDDRRAQYRAQNSTDDLIFDYQYEAEAALHDLLDVYYRYGCARVSDLYDIVGTTSEFTDEKFGWTNGVNGLEHARIKRVRDGWMLVLPRIMPVD